MNMLTLLLMTAGLAAVASTSNLDQSLAQLELLKSFIQRHHCIPDMIVGNDESLIAELSAGLGTELMPPGPKKLGNDCRAVLILSSKGLAMNRVEHLAIGSLKSIIIVVGPDHEELDTENSLRPIYFLQPGDRVTAFHVFCPSLHGSGEWVLNQGVWIKSRRQMKYLTGKDHLDVCSSPLVNSKVEVAWVERKESKLFNVVIYSQTC